MSKIILPRTAISSDAPSPRQRGPQLPPMFSTDPVRNPGQSGVSREIPVLPDRQLVATYVALGCPEEMAWQIVRHPSGRFQLVAVWCLVRDAEEGLTVYNGATGEAKPAREVVDMIRHQLLEARRAELISDNPEHTVGIFER